MTAGSKIGFQPQPIAPSDIEQYREYNNTQLTSMRNIFFNQSRSNIDLKSMVKLYNNERNRNRRK